MKHQLILKYIKKFLGSDPFDSEQGIDIDNDLEYVFTCRYYFTADMRFMFNEGCNPGIYLINTEDIYKYIKMIEYLCKKGYELVVDYKNDLLYEKDAWNSNKLNSLEMEEVELIKKEDVYFAKDLKEDKS